MTTMRAVSLRDGTIALRTLPMPVEGQLLASPVEAATAMVQRNCVVPLQMCHHFAASMVERGRGGIAILGSAAGFVGAPNMVAYAASKAFDMVMAEALWAELSEQGVDVLGLILGETDTPALRRLRRSLGHEDDPDTPLASAATMRSRTPRT